MSSAHSRSGLLWSWLVLFSLAVPLGCDPVGRGGGPHGSEDPPQAGTHEKAGSPSTSAGRATGPAEAPHSLPASPAHSEAHAPCVIPLADPPPPKAEPASSCPPAVGQAPVLPRGMVHFVDAPGAPGVEVEIATRAPEQARGLMYRTSLPSDAGMLFSWPYAAPRSFWMRNTCIPLDMLFIDEQGTIAGILREVPTLNQLPRRIPCRVHHVLEVNAGWTREHGVVPGQRVKLPKEHTP